MKKVVTIEIQVMADVNVNGDDEKMCRRRDEKTIVNLCLRTHKCRNIRISLEIDQNKQLQLLLV